MPTPSQPATPPKLNWGPRRPSSLAAVAQERMLLAAGAPSGSPAPAPAAQGEAQPALAQSDGFLAGEGAQPPAAASPTIFIGDALADDQLDLAEGELLTAAQETAERLGLQFAQTSDPESLDVDPATHFVWVDYDYSRIEAMQADQLDRQLSQQRKFAASAAWFRRSPRAWAPGNGSARPQGAVELMSQRAPQPAQTARLSNPAARRAPHRLGQSAVFSAHVGRPRPGAPAVESPIWAPWAQSAAERAASVPAGAAILARKQGLANEAPQSLSRLQAWRQRQQEAARRRLEGEAVAPAQTRRGFSAG